MKKIFVLYLAFHSISTFANIETDTINNWQLYKDNKLIFKSNEVEKSSKIIEISTIDSFKVLKLDMFYDFFDSKTPKKIEFIVENIVVNFYTDDNQARESFIIKKAKIKNLITKYKDKTIKIKYYDKIYPKGIIVCQLKFI